MTAQTQTRTILDLTVAGHRRRAFVAVESFKADVEKNGIGHAISWGAVPAIVGEMVLEALARFDRAVDEYGLDRAVEFAALERENVDRQIGYFDPTSHSTSASSTLTGAAEFQGHRAVRDLLDEIVGSRSMDVENAG